MTSTDANSSLGAQARLRLVFLKALFSRRPMAVVNRWETEQFRQAVNRAAGVDVRVSLDGKELSQAFRTYFAKERAKDIA